MLILKRTPICVKYSWPMYLSDNRWSIVPFVIPALHAILSFISSTQVDIHLARGHDSIFVWDRVVQSPSRRDIAVVFRFVTCQINSPKWRTLNCNKTCSVGFDMLSNGLGRLYRGLIRCTMVPGSDSDFWEWPSYGSDLAVGDWSDL